MHVLITSDTLNGNWTYTRELVSGLITRGLRITLTRFLTKVKATYKGTSYIVSTGCTGGKYNFAGDFTFIDGAGATNSVTAKATSKC